ncbi:hypothetical protein [Candidimonas nitroreducens]|uniref:Uncharacterized protein n=1 Tax=Candidimonas nitroreducens TaxID=683354 RepID=A0A225M9S4_9BURK|nr:hypothetical protein [Candidimonas nitroreducens]OWT56830.1 hypothetical protein CEY11_18290 [Candidimonas nitroreducens]
MKLSVGVIYAMVLVTQTAVGAATPGVVINGKPTASETQALKRAMGADYGDLQPFEVGHADLNDDHRPDLLARSDSTGGCGSAGCQTYAVLATSAGYARKSIRLAAAGGKVFVLPSKHHGMHDLRFESGTYTFKWNGKEYQ